MNHAYVIQQTEIVNSLIAFIKYELREMSIAEDSSKAFDHFDNVVSYISDFKAIEPKKCKDMRDDECDYHSFYCKTYHVLQNFDDYQMLVAIERNKKEFISWKVNSIIEDLEKI